MCGRIVLADSPERLIGYFDLTEAFDFQPGYNIAPTDPVITITADEQEHRHIMPMQWGFIPHWAKLGDAGFEPINAKSETVATNGLYRSAFRARRCLIPVSGFYEWKTEKGAKYPWYISLKSGEPLAIAGLWATWHPKPDETAETCCIITTSANELMQPIHDRMPVILDKGQWDTWLSPNIHNPDKLLPMLHPHDAASMQAWRVSRDVNKTGYRNDAGLITPAED